LLYIRLRVIYVHDKGKGKKENGEKRPCGTKEALRSGTRHSPTARRYTESRARITASRAAGSASLRFALGDFPVARYDRGWGIEPETENAQLAVAAILHSLNYTEKRLFLSYIYTTRNRIASAVLFCYRILRERRCSSYGDQRKKADSNCDQGAGRKSRKTKTE
jgi:hypothetical protein